MRIPLSMNTGSFELAPLSEYKITERKFRVAGDVLPEVNFNHWMSEYNATGKKLAWKWRNLCVGHDELHINHPRPADVDVVYPPDHVVWADDPGYIPYDVP